MRYWHPFTDEAIHRLEGHAPEEVVLLPLYPQYSKTTTGSSLNEWTRCYHPNGWSPRVHIVKEFYEDPAYLSSVVESGWIGRWPVSPTLVRSTWSLARA